MYIIWCGMGGQIGIRQNVKGSEFRGALTGFELCAAGIQDTDAAQSCVEYGGQIQFL